MSPAERAIADETEASIKADFRELGFPICEPRDSGKGTSNDGNLARNVLKNHAAFMAEKCGISEKLLNGFYFLYIALASHLPLCPQKIEESLL